MDEVPNQLKQKLDETKRIEAQLTSNRVTSEDVNSYISLKNLLAAIGFGDVDTYSIANIIRNFKAQSLDANRIVKIASSIIPLENQEEILQNQLIRVQNSLSNWNHLIPLLQAVKDVSVDTVAPNGLRMLFNCINHRVVTDRVTPMLAAQRIMIDIEQLHQITGFEREIQAKQLQVQSLEDKIEELQEKWATNLASIQTLVRLARRGVTGDNILAFDNFFRTNQEKISLSSFETNLEKYGKMRKLLDDLEIKTVKKIQQYWALESEINSLKQAATDLSQMLDSANNDADSVIEKSNGLQSKLTPLEAKLTLLDEKEKCTSELERIGVRDTQQSSLNSPYRTSKETEGTGARLNEYGLPHHYKTYGLQPQASQLPNTKDENQQEQSIEDLDIDNRNDGLVLKKPFFYELFPDWKPQVKRLRGQEVHGA